MKIINAQVIDLANEYQGLIFDMDGTLIDTMPAHLTAWHKTSVHFGFPFDESWLHSLGGMPSYKITEQINLKYGLSLDPTIVSNYKMEAFSALDNHGSVISSTVKVVEHFYGKKSMAVGTGSQRVSAERLLKENNLRSKFSAVVSANDVENHKPNPDTFEKAAKLLNIDCKRCLVFEDTELGKRAAHAAGMDCIMVESSGLVFYPKP